ncbi:MAG: glycosyltransferase family 87 protein [Lachnospiraceae bacterium]|nr:glycosyltransferase family 87 protein [Lachnospiraceae bacterium]
MQIENKNKKIAWNLISVILGVLAVLSIVQGCRNAILYSQDFQWDAVKALTLRINPYLESLNPSGVMNSLGYEEYFKQMEANQFPSLLILLLPYTFLEPMAARYAWLISNLLFTIGIAFLLRKTFLKDLNKQYYQVLILLMIAGTPWRNQIGVGQHTLFSFLFFLLAVWFSENNRVFSAAISLTVCYFKYTLTVPLTLYFVYKRKWKELGISILIHVVLTFLAAAWLGESFISMIIQPLKVSSALVGEGSLDIGALLGGSSSAMMVTVFIMMFLLALAIFFPNYQDKLLISILLLWSLIVTYHRSYDYFVLILPFCYFIDGEKSAKKYETIMYVILVLSVFFILRVFHESSISLLCVGAFYYLVTIIMTIKGIQTCISGRKIKHI